MVLYYRRLAVTAVDLLHGVADLLHRGVGPHGFKGRVHGVLAPFGRLFDRPEAPFYLLVVPALPELPETLYLRLFDLARGLVRLDVALLLGLVDVDVDDVALLFLELALVAGEGLDKVRTTKRVYGVGHTGLQGCYLLGAHSDPYRLLRRERERLVKGVGVQALGAAEDRGQGLKGGARHVV